MTAAPGGDVTGATVPASVPPPSGPAAFSLGVGPPPGGAENPDSGLRGVLPSAF